LGFGYHLSDYLHVFVTQSFLWLTVVTNAGPINCIQKIA
jgi:hypothetical protein